MQRRRDPPHKAASDSKSDSRQAVIKIDEMIRYRIERRFAYHDS
jgi:hypothetical protein